MQKLTLGEYIVLVRKYMRMIYHHKQLTEETLPQAHIKVVEQLSKQYPEFTEKIIIALDNLLEAVDVLGWYADIPVDKTSKN